MENKITFSEFEKLIEKKFDEVEMTPRDGNAVIVITCNGETKETGGRVMGRGRDIVFALTSAMSGDPQLRMFVETALLFLHTVKPGDKAEEQAQSEEFKAMDKAVEGFNNAISVALNTKNPS